MTIRTARGGAVANEKCKMSSFAAELGVSTSSSAGYFRSSYRPRKSISQDIAGRMVPSLVKIPVFERQV